MPQKPSSLIAKFGQWRKRASLPLIEFGISIAITVAALTAWTGITSSPPHYKFIEDAELSTLDTRFRVRGPRPHDDNIVIVDMDEKTLQALKAFPIPRRAYAHLLDQLTKGGAKIVVFDVDFPTPAQNSAEDALKKLLGELDNTVPETVAQKIRALEAAGDDDKIFAEALRRNGNVLLAHFFLDVKNSAPTVSVKVEADYDSLLSNHAFHLVQKVRKGSEKDFDIDSVWQQAQSFQPTEVFGNIRPLAEASRSYGFIDILPDDDSTYRRTILLLAYRGEFYPSLDIEAVHQYEDINDESMVARIGAQGMESVELGSHDIRTDPDATVLINYAGPYETYRHYSMIDVMNGTVSEEIFRRKLVLVGPTALGFGDRRDTPFVSVNAFMGVEVHANVIDNILHNTERGRGFLSRNGREFIIDFCFIVFFGICLSPWFSRKTPWVTTTTAVAAGALFLAFNYFAFVRWGMWLSVVVPMGTLLANYLAILSLRIFFVEREKKKLHQMFGLYLSPEVIKLMEDDPKRYMVAGGEAKELTLLFSDIRGFTGISEGLTADQLVKLLNEYLSEMTEILMIASLGFVDKFIGDAIMGFWGSPYPHPNHAELACECALKMGARLDELNLKWEVEGKKPLKIGIGLNTGEVIVGNMGSISRKLSWTVMGDHVNLASRLEGTTKAYHVRILVSEFLYQHKFQSSEKDPGKRISDSFVFRELDRIRVVGKEQPVKIYELMATAKDAAHYSELLALWTNAYAAYVARDWSAAASKFEVLLKKYPDDGPAQVYLERVRGFLKAPPPRDWDGVFVMKEK